MTGESSKVNVKVTRPGWQHSVLKGQCEGHKTWLAALCFTRDQCEGHKTWLAALFYKVNVKVTRPGWQHSGSGR
jgi:hypothetical protein